MCVFCDKFRGRTRGYEELDNKLLEKIEIRVGIEMDYGTFLMVRRYDEVVTAIPISYCPLCGSKIGGVHE